VRCEATTKIDASGDGALALTAVSMGDSGGFDGRRFTMARRLTVSALALLIVLDGASSPGVVRAADSTVAEEALERLPISADQRRQLLRNEVVSYPVNETSERELAVGLAVFVSAPLDHVAEYLGSGDLLAHDATISAHGRDALPAVLFTDKERGEAESLLDAAPGTRFNVSPAEIDALRALRTSPVTAPQGADGYRKLLRDRWQAYERGGLGAMAPYARAAGAATDPAAQLRLGLADAERVARYGPRLREALTSYPAGQPPELVNRVYWIKRRVQRRPQLSLLHQMVMRGPDLVVHVERYFYVGHSYNAAQIITGAFAYGNGTVVFAACRFSTDEVLGVGNQLKRSVGRGQLREEMRKRLEAVAHALSRPVTPAPQTP